MPDGEVDCTRISWVQRIVLIRWLSMHVIHDEQPRRTERECDDGASCADAESLQRPMLNSDRLVGSNERVLICKQN
jgi:hypothetical protein